MTSRNELITADGGQHFAAYVSVPETPNGHAVIVLQEIFGVTPTITAVADRFAAEGFLALAPDLFWRVEPGLSLSHSKEDMQRAFAVLEVFDEDLGVQDIGHAINHAKGQPGVHGGVAVVGMCLGGKLAYLAASRLSVDACVAFYGVGIEKNLDEADKITAPLLMFFGGKDKYAPASAREKIAAAVKGKRHVDLRVYDDADHGFYTRGDPGVIRDAHAEAMAFLQQNLQQAGATA